MPSVSPGARLRSATCDTEVVVVRTDASDVDVRCGGAPLLAWTETRPPGGVPAPEFASGTSLGKRYASADGKVEVLCTKPGDGSLSIGTEPMAEQVARPLPSSD